MQVSCPLVPDNDVTGWDAGGKQPLNNGSHDCRSGATVGAGSRKDLKTNNILGGDETGPGCAEGCLAGEVCDGSINHQLNYLRHRVESVQGARVFNHNHAGVGAIGIAG